VAEHENTKNYYLDPQIKLSFTNLVSTHVFITVQAEQSVAVHLPEQRLSFNLSKARPSGVEPF
jgi:hypothetical protein